MAENPAYVLRIGVPEADADAYWPRPVIRSSGQRMRFERLDREFLINHSALHDGGAGERRLLADPDALERLADSVADSFIHEISHARELGRAQPYVPHVMDDELAAAYREQLFLLDALERDEGFNRLAEALELQLEVGRRVRALRAARRGRDAGLEALGARYDALVTPDRLDALARLQDLARSTRAFEAGFAAAYSKSVPYLSWDSARELREERRLLAGVEDSVAHLERELAALDPASRQAERKRVRARRIRQIAQTQRLNIQFWGSPERVGEARARYARLLGGLRARLGARRAESRALKRLAAAPPGSLRTRYRFGPAPSAGARSLGGR
ncbi:MAG: hypothetical protein HY554_10760 [Elusimicrobia bacterium]|nr:hypothetical protein [Elusimicrobiota bacterium]